MTKDEALKKCLRVLEPIAEQRMYEAQWVVSAILACKETLEQTTQEPVGYVHEDQYGYGASLKVGLNHGTKLYTQPKEWQGLSDDELDEIRKKSGEMTDHGNFVLNEYEFAKAIEQKLKEKNCGSH